MCSHIIVFPHVHHARACAWTQKLCSTVNPSVCTIAVTALDVCGMLLCNLTLALSKAHLRSTTLSFPSCMGGSHNVYLFSQYGVDKARRQEGGARGCTCTPPFDYCTHGWSG